MSAFHKDLVWLIRGGLGFKGIQWNSWQIRYRCRQSWRWNLTVGTSGICHSRTLFSVAAGFRHCL